jgi:hypothetical protein
MAPIHESRRLDDTVMIHRFRLVTASLSLGLLAVATPLSAGAAGIALVTDVVGNATLAALPSGSLKLLGELDAGVEVAIADHAQLVVFYLAQGAEYTLNGPGRYRILASGPEPLRGASPPERKATAAAYKELRLKTDRVAQGGMVMRGDPILISPVTEVVLDGDATFRWRPFTSEASYQFELVDQAGVRLLTSETRDTEIRLPPSLALVPGHTYYWSLRGRDAGGNTFYRAAEFRIADAALRRQIEAAQPKPDASFSERVLFAALLEETGMKTAAQAQRRALAAERPVAWADAR